MEFQNCVINQYQKNVKFKRYCCEGVTTLPDIWSCFCISKLPTWKEAHEESNKLKKIKVLNVKKVNIVPLNIELYKKKQNFLQKSGLLIVHIRALNII